MKQNDQELLFSSSRGGRGINEAGWNNSPRLLHRLSSAQLGIWLAQALDPNSAIYSQCECVEIFGAIDPVLLAQAVRQAVHEADALHLRFVETEDGPRQYVGDTQWSVSCVDFSAEAAPHAAAEGWMQDEMARVADLARGPLFAAAILRTAPDRYIYFQRAHHLVVDGVAGVMFARRVAALYSSLSEGRPAEASGSGSFADLLDDEEEYRRSPGFARDQKYWREQLRDRPPPVTVSGRPPARSGSFLRGNDCIPGAAANALRALAKRHECTLPQLITAAAALYLGRVSGAADLVIGMPVTARLKPKTRGVIGMTSNVVPVRLNLDLCDDLNGLMRQAAQKTRAALRHQRYRIEDLRRDFGLPPDADFYGLIVNVMPFDYEALRFGGHAVRADNLCMGPAEDLQIVVFDRPGGGDLRVLFNANPAHYTPEELAVHQQRFLQLLTGLPASAPDTALHRLDLLGPGERQRVLESFNATAHAVPETTLPELFETQVARTPEAMALVSDGEELTYGELDARANRLAHHLIGLGIGPESLVGLALDRSVEIVVALLGVLKAGGAYLPLDPDYPRARLEQMLTDARPVTVISVSSLDGRLPPAASVVELDQPATRAALARMPAHNPRDAERRPTLRGQHPAYVIYTSGSTGTPKGVVVTHNALVNHIMWMAAAYPLNPRDRMLFRTSINFDPSVCEIWLPLVSGAAICLTAGDAGDNPAALLETMKRQQVSVAQFVPTLLSATLDAAGERPHTLRLVFSGGEALPPELAQRVTRQWRVSLVNLFGPTETTIWVTHACMGQEFPDNQPVSIGAPIWNTRAYVLDADLEAVPVGVAGELYIAGIALARGYLNRPALTAERFVADPHAAEPGGRMYRTGDLARWRADGTLEHLGRVDQQIKIRGFRIELGEIEAALRSHERVQDALVAVHGHGIGRQLLGYVLGRQTDEERSQTQTSHVTHWQQLYESAYAQDGQSADDFNVIGWTSSYTGQPIASEDMRSWVDETVAQLRALRPRRVLEIGCGTGLLLTRLAPACESYIGLDFSATVLAQLGEYAAQRDDLRHLDLRLIAANDLSFLGDGAVDLVILNSVVQYFPDVDYLLDVLAEAARVTRSGGQIFVGDVRSLPLLAAFHCSVQTYKASADTALADLRHRIVHSQHNEKELAIDPALFGELGRRWPQIGRVETALKPGRYDNELSRFRYDVTLWLGDKAAMAPPQRWLDWDDAGHWRDGLEQALAMPGTSVGVRGIRDRRVAEAVETLRLLNAPGGSLANAGQLRAACSASGGEDPDAVRLLARRLGVAFCWAGFAADGLYDAVFSPRWEAVQGAPEYPRSSYRRYGNAPSHGVLDAELGRTLRQHLQQSLPAYMVPSAVMVLPSLPLTPNGKVDRGALPVPGRPGVTSEPHYMPPFEEIVADTFKQALGCSHVGIHDNFFDLGGHSLLTTKVAARLERLLALSIAPAWIFQAPTPAQLAKLLDAKLVAASSHVTPLQPLGDRPPLFCMHDLISRPLSYVSLARLMAPDQPVYGLGPGPLESAFIANPSLRLLTEAYVAEIKAIQPCGPYRIVGYSFGGVPAFDLACALEAAGDGVHLILIDSYVGGGVPGFLPMAKWILRHRRQALKEMYWFRDRLFKPRGLIRDSEIPEWVPKNSRPLARALLQAQATNNFRPFRGSTMFLESTARGLAQELLNHDGLNGWRDLLKGPLLSLKLQAPHFWMMRDPLVGEIARILRTC